MDRAFIYRTIGNIYDLIGVLPIEILVGDFFVVSVRVVVNPISRFMIFLVWSHHVL